MIVFCGVHFMAETAAILAADRRVVIPEPRAGCPMADMVDVPGLEALKAQHPERGRSQLCQHDGGHQGPLRYLLHQRQRSAGGRDDRSGDREIIFTPDMNLGSWVTKKTGREMILWPGFCPTHQLYRWSRISWRPRPRTRCQGGRPSGMPVRSRRYGGRGGEHLGHDPLSAARIDAREYLIGTELGMIYRLSQGCTRTRSSIP